MIISPTPADIVVTTERHMHCLCFEHFHAFAIISSMAKVSYEAVELDAEERNGIDCEVCALVLEERICH